MNRREMVATLIGAPLAALFARGAHAGAQGPSRRHNTVYTWSDDIVWPNSEPPQLPNSDRGIVHVTVRRVGDQLVGQWMDG